jgi:DNA polymerase-3 subunit chi
MQEIYCYMPHENFAKKFVPKLLEQIISKGNRVLVLCKDSEEMRSLDEFLWLYEQLSFLPHVTQGDEQKEVCPIVLATEHVNHNNANVLLALNHQVVKDAQVYEKIILVGHHSGKGPDLKVLNGQVRAGAKFSYFNQTKTGAWEKAAA